MPSSRSPSPTNDVGIVIDDGIVGPVEGGRQECLGQRHADGRGKALPQRAGGRLDARRDAVFGMAGREAAELAELLELLHRQIVAGQVQQAVDQHRAVPAGEDEAVAVEPLRVGRVVAQEARPQHVSDGRHAHRHAGMARIGLLHAVHRQATDHVGAENVYIIETERG